MIIYWKSAHPQVIRDQDEFVSSSGLEKCVSVMEVNGLPSEWESIKTSQ